MAQVFGIADLHLGHRNMALKRGFATVEEHDEFIIANWNKVVSKRDKVIIFGDLTMEKKYSYYLLDRMNGTKVVIGGNHDSLKHSAELLKYVSGICGMMKRKGFILTHCPIHESQLEGFYINIHGHVHEKTLQDPRYINLSCEVIGFTPVLLSNYVNKNGETKPKKDE
jgi:calcineurin-like phosphoesterase family protein